MNFGRRFGRLCALSICMAIVLSGCSFGISVDNLLSPPTLSYEQSEIYDALISSIGAGRVNLVYPREGDYRSAFIVENFADIEADQALVFYEAVNVDNIDRESSIRINILSKNAGKWVSVYDHAAIGTGIDRVIFSNLGNNTIDKNIIIGFNMLPGDKNLRVYAFRNGVLETLYSSPYYKMFIADLDGSGENGLFIINLNNSDNTQSNTQSMNNPKAYISVVKEVIQNDADSNTDKHTDEVLQTSLIALNSDTTDIANVVYGNVGPGRRALFIDGFSAGQLTTEVIYSIDGELRNPIYLGGSDILKDTRRPMGYLSLDIDGDNIIEIPTVSYFPGYNAQSEEPFFITDWNVFENFSITKKYSSFYNIGDGYCFIIPTRWENVVTVKADKIAGDVVFYRYSSDAFYEYSVDNSSDNIIRGLELLRFCDVRSDDVNGLAAKIAAGYEVINETEQLTYLFKIPVDTDDPLVLTNTEIVNNFYIMI